VTEPLEGPPGTCPRCGAPFSPGQEYCLECGLRLAPRVSRLDWWRRQPWYPGDWIWPVLVFLVLAGLGALIAVIATRNSNNETIVATPPPVTTNASIAPTVPATTAATTTAPPATVPTTTAATTAPATATTLIAWPNRSGYTVVLQSIPTPSGRTQALQIARRALATGLREVGVLDSSNYSSLHPGYYVVFSGVYDTLDEAQGAVAGAKTAGFTLAYARPVTQ
jgi:hypothetical protein